MNKFLQVYTTTDSKEIAEKIADTLVEEKLAQCVQITGPIKSVYRWKGKIERTEEWLCVIKCTQRNYRGLEQKIKKLHTYEVPEIVAVPIIRGSKDYLKWLEG
jgi:periplasmic divalent cation tolerance protein